MSARFKPNRERASELPLLRIIVQNQARFPLQRHAFVLLSQITPIRTFVKRSSGSVSFPSLSVRRVCSYEASETGLLPVESSIPWHQSSQRISPDRGCQMHCVSRAQAPGPFSTGSDHRRYSLLSLSKKAMEAFFRWEQTGWRAREPCQGCRGSLETLLSLAG